MRYFPGMVERFGPARISGWVAYTPEGGRDVVVKVNGREVARTIACRPVRYNGEIRDFGFVRMLGGLFDYIGKDDKVTVEYNRMKLPIAGQGLVYVHPEDTVSRVGDLQRRIRRGFIFDKKGRLAKQLRRQSRESFFAELEKLRDQIREKFGCELFVIYGTLLGCIREGDFIAQDNDLDFTYISRFNRPEEVRAEFLAICEFLIDSGFSGLLTRHSFNVKSPLKFDIIFSWFNEDGQYQLAFGWHGPELQRNAMFEEMVEGKLGQHSVQVPSNAEGILAQIYGSNWRVPDPGFSHYSKTRKQNERFAVPYEQQRPLYWKQFYKRVGLAERSSFAAWLLPQLPSNSTIVDVGCGVGQDAVFFAEHGHRVYGIDASEEAVSRARQLAEDRNAKNCTFAAFELGQPNELAKILRAAKGEASNDSVVVYLRFLLHAVTEDVETLIYDTLDAELGRFTIAAEFRTLADQLVPKIFAPHYTRYIDSKALVEALSGRGLKVAHFEEGTGLSVFTLARNRKVFTEDPHLCRIVAAK